MKKIANDLLYRFEAELFQNDGVYSRNVNLVLAFDEYVRCLSDSDIAEIVGSEEMVAAFRSMIDTGVDAWLDACSLKTLCLR